MQKKEFSVYCCMECGAIYEEEYGDSDTKVPAGTAFEELPDFWCCPVCHGKKGAYVKVE
ncbi:MAG: rubredoxin [archaeon]